MIRVSNDGTITYYATMTEIKNHILKTRIGTELPAITHRGKPILTEDADVFCKRGLLKYLGNDKYCRIY